MRSLDYEMYFTSWFDQYSQPALQTHVTSLGACQAKALEARALLRVMSGSRLNLEREAKMVAMMAGMLGADGLYWVPGGRPDKPWLQIPEPFAMVHGQGGWPGRCSPGINTLATRYGRTGSTRW